MALKYYLAGDVDAPEGASLFVQDENSDIQVSTGMEIEITEDQYNFYRKTCTRTDSGNWISAKGLQVLEEKEDRQKRQYEERQERLIDFYARKVKKEIELGIISKEDVELYLSQSSITNLHSSSIMDKLNNSEV